MRLFNLDPIQAVRLRRTLIALGAALFLSGLAYYFYLRGLMHVRGSVLVWLNVVFWGVNAILVIMLSTGRNRRFRDPSLTLPQILWATIAVLVVAYLMDEQRYLVLFIYMLVMLFGCFRLKLREFLLVTASASLGYALVIVLAYANRPEVVDPKVEAATWAVFTIVMLAFATIGSEISQLRSRLAHDNRDLDAARRVAEAANRAKTDFLATMSHEVRTPMNSLVGLPDVMAGVELNRTQMNYFDSAKRAGQQLMTMLDNIRDLAQIEQGNMQLVHVPFDVGKVVNEIESTMLPRAKEKGLELLVNLSPRVPRHIVGDPERLREVLGNLTGNAIKFTGDGSIRLDVDRPDDAGIEVTVSDTGIGIAEDRQHEIFKPFSTIDAPMTRQFGGIGIGLPASRHIVELMGGHISIADNPKGGSIFRFNIPVEIPESSPITQSEKFHQGDRRYSVLLVDDSEDNRLLIQAYLGQTTCDVNEAEDGLQAIELFKAKPYDLVLMDIHMPGMDGLTTTRQIRAWEEANRDTRTSIVALTADTVSLGLNESRDAGCDDFVTKPITKEAMFQLLHTHLGIPVP